MSSLAYAQDGHFGPDSDVLGISLSMTQNQALNFMKKNHPNLPLAMLSVNAHTQDYRTEAVAGFVVNMTPNGTTDWMSGDLASFDTERLKVLFDMNRAATNILSVSRSVRYNFKNTITITSLRQSLIDKYGKPTSVTQSGMGGETTYVWTRIPAAYNARTCPSNYHYFSATVGYGESRSGALRANQDEFLSYISSDQAFIRVPFLSHQNCGTMLIVSASTGLGDRSDYVDIFSETLIDVSGGIAALEKFRNEFWTKANQLKNERLAKDSAGRPKL
jgi:hypothetical protein